MKSNGTSVTIGLLAALWLVGPLSLRTMAQSSPQAKPASPSEGCCTPEATAKFASSAGFVDVAGIKLGMPAQEALAAVKAANPAFKVNLQRLPQNWDVMAGLSTDMKPDPQKRWAFGIEASTPSSGGAYENLIVTLSTPPNSQVVINVARQIDFPSQAPPTVEGIVAGLRKKYGPESYLMNIGPSTLTWIFDTGGHLISDRNSVNRLLGGGCGPLARGDQPPDLAPYTPDSLPQIAGNRFCEGFVFVKAQVDPTIAGGKFAGNLTVTATNYPLTRRSQDTTWVWLYQIRQGLAAKKLKEAETRGNSVKY